MIKNCTAVPLKIQLCQVGVLYHGVVQPGECFVRETGAVHFTIRATVSDKDDTDWTDIVLPVIGAVAGGLAALATAGAGLVIVGSGAAAAAGAGAAGTIAMEGLVTGAAVMTSGGILTAGGVLLTKTIAQKLFQDAKQSHFYLSSAGWYCGGKNELEIRGGPQILANPQGFSYNGSPLYIVDKYDDKRRS